MIETIGAPELIIIALVIILLFGVGKMANLGRDLGASVREFRHAIRDEDGVPDGDVPPGIAPRAPPPAPPPGAPPTTGKPPHVF